MLRFRALTAGVAGAALVATLAACGDEPTGPEDPHPTTDTAAPVADPALGSWQELAELPQARTELSAVAHDGLLYVAGGFASPRDTRGELPTALFIYDPAADSWSEGAPLPEGRHHAPLVGHDGRLYLVGGYRGAEVGSWETTDTLYVYDIAADAWEEGPPLPEPRGAHAVAVTGDGNLHVVGGVEGGARAEHFVFDVAAQSWSSAPELPTAREHLGAAYHDGVIYVVAGRADGVSDLTTFEAYELATGQWQTLPDLPTGRSGIAVVAFDGHIYVFGGEVVNSRTFADAERYDPAGGSWRRLPPMPTSRHGLGAGVIGEGIVVVGGGPHHGLTYSTVTELWLPDPP